MTTHTPPWLNREDHHVQARGHAIEVCGGTTGHVGRAAAFCDTAERAAEIVSILRSHDALVTALEEIARSPDCGCRPCRGQCRSESALRIWKEDMQDIARAALARATGQEG